MSIEIGTVKTLVGKFWIHSPNGESHLAVIGEMLHEGDRVVGGSGNTSNSTFSIDLVGNIDQDIALGANEVLALDRTFMVNVLGMEDASSIQPPLVAAWEGPSEELSIEIEDDKDVLAVDDTQMGDTETAAGGAASDGQITPANFDERTGAITDVRTALLATAADTVAADMISPLTSSIVLEEEEFINNAPVFVDFTEGPGAPVESYSFTYNENNTAGVILGTVHATDLDSDTVTYLITAGNDAGYFAIDPVTGAITLTQAGVEAYTNNFETLANVHNLTVGASDGTNTTTIGVTLGEMDVNDVTAVVSDTAITNEDTSIIIDVTANDTDEDAKSPVDTVTQGANGSVTINADGTVTYTPNTNWSGVDSFSYTNLEGHTATVNVTVTPVADALIPNGGLGVILGPEIIYDLEGNPNGGTTYTTPEGIIITGSNALHISNGLGIGVNSPGGTGEEANRIDPGESISFVFPVGIQSMSMDVKNTKDDTLKFDSQLQIPSSSPVSISGALDVGLINPLSDVNISLTIVGTTGTVTANAIVTSTGAWSISNLNTSGIGTIVNSTLTTQINGDVFKNGGDSLGFYVNVAMANMVVSNGTIYGNNDGYQIEKLLFGVESSTSHTYAVDVNALLSDIDTSERLGAVSLSGFPSGSSLQVVHTDGTWSDISADSSGNFSLDPALLSNTFESGVDKVYLTTSSTLPTDFSPNLTVTSVENANGDSAITILGGSANSVLDGGDGNDYISGGAGVDSLDGGDGNDTLVSDINTNLGTLNTTTDNGTGALDGGTGMDTLILAKDGNNIDFSVMGVDGVIKNIETIDLGHGGDADNHILSNLTLDDVIQMTDANNTLTIMGDASDFVNIPVHTGNYTAPVITVDGGYDIYTYESATDDPTVILKIETTIADTVV